MVHSILATHISACFSSLCNVKSYTNFGLHDEPKIAIQNGQKNSHPPCQELILNELLRRN